MMDPHPFHLKSKYKENSEGLHEKNSYKLDLFMEEDNIINTKEF